MSEGNLDRVREDLAAMRQVLGLRPRFGREHVCVSFALAIVGTVVAALTAWTEISVRPTRSGSMAHWVYIALIGVPALLVLTVMSLMARHRKAETPLLWRESRLSWIFAAIAVPLYLAFIAWAVKNDISAGAVTAATFFVTGLFLLMDAVSDRRRWYTLGWAVSTLLAGVCAPMTTYESAGLLAGGWLFLGGISTAAILAWQLRSGSDHAAH
jgi:bacteriorhodopsin